MNSVMNFFRGNATAPHTTEAKLAVQKFDQDELHVLKKTWQDLADRSNGKGIDKDTFLQYFPLNGLLGDRLFAQFDCHKRGYIDFDDFITGLATVCRGTLDDKVHFVFNMYDVSHDNTVSKQELTTLLNHIPREAFHPELGYLNQPGTPSLNTPNLVRDTSNSLIHSDSQSDSDTHSMHGDVTNTGVASALNPGDEENVDSYTNHDVVERAFAECDLNHEGRLSYEEFKMWINRNPSILEYIESILPYNGPKDTHMKHHKKETLPHLKRVQSRFSAHLSLQRTHSGQGVDGFGGNDFGHGPSLGSRKMSHGGLASPLPMNSPYNKPDGVSGANTNNASLAGQSLSRNSSFSQDSSVVSSNQRFSMGGGHLAPLNTNITGVNTPQGSVRLSHSPSVVVTEADEQTKQILLHALESTTNQDLKFSILSLLEAHFPMHDLIAAPRMTSTEAYNQMVAKEDYLWKKGKSMFHLLSKRYYLVSGNCMYYYLHKTDVRVKGVIFLTGNLIERVKDREMEMQGYYGFEIIHQDLSDDKHPVSVHHKHERRLLYCKSEEEREKWVVALQHAAHVVPIEDDYVIGRELGRGRFSIVCECVHKVTGKHCAVKIIDKTAIEPEEKALLRTEIAVLKLVHHPNIIRMEGLYESKQYLYIVMEMLKGGELFERIVGRPRFTESEAAKLMKPLLESVAYLHDLGIVHRDLKPENILCGDNLEDLKIADFGLSKMVLPKEKMDAACGTLSYVAPEVLTMQGYGKEADLWSVGVILFLLLCGKLPFDGDDHNEIIRSTIQADLKVSASVWNKLSEEAKGLITALLNKNPKERITARDALKHPFIVNNTVSTRRMTLQHPPLPNHPVTPGAGLASNNAFATSGSSTANTAAAASTAHHIDGDVPALTRGAAVHGNSEGIAATNSMTLSGDNTPNVGLSTSALTSPTAAAIAK